MSADTVVLTVDEAAVLALRLIVEHLHVDDEWLMWEDVPLLAEGSFEMVEEAVKSHVRQLTVGLTRQERLLDIDSAHLLERAR